MGETAAPIGEVISVTADDPSVALYDLEDAGLEDCCLNFRPRQ